MPKVSIILSSYNHGKYIADAIQSILNQTFNDFELIIIDDASKDDTFKILQTFNDPRMKIQYNKVNLGVNVNRNRYIEQAKGEYIAIMNADDEWLPTKLEKQVKFLDENPEIGAVFTHANIIDDKGDDFADKDHPYYNEFHEQNRTRFEWLNIFFYSGNHLCHPSVLMRKKCHEDIGYYDLRLGQLVDYDLWIRLCMKYDIHVIPEKLIKFRVLSDESNISGNRPETNKRVRWVSIQILKNYLKIRTTSDFLKIFPEATKYKHKIDDSLIPFFLAQLAIEANKEKLNFFAIDTLFKLMGDTAIARKLEEKCTFKYNDLIKLTGKYDLFNIVKVKELTEELESSKKRRFLLF